MFQSVNAGWAGVYRGMGRSMMQQQSIRARITHAPGNSTLRVLRQQVEYWSPGVLPTRRFGMYSLARVAVASLLLAAASPSAAVAQSDVQEIQPLLDEMQLAANTHNTDRFLASYLRGPDLVFVFNGGIIHGWDALREQQLKWWKNGTSDMVYGPRGAPVFTPLGPGFVVVTSPLVSRRTMPDGTVSSGEFAVTMVWQKRPEGWRIVAAHESTRR